ncbi:MAG: Methionyl-tRNA formyltransferase [Candidatus Doudnabacteria bacterium]|nr:Methionyl-tRNA formyltransferase [Candidatus Doudnabacteria bacterium]
MTKILFFGTSDFSAKILKALSNQFEIVGVVTQTDKAVGRKKEFRQSPVAIIAGELGFKVLKPQSLKNEEALNQIKALNADIFVVIAYGKIIPQNILDLAKQGAINIHPSLLPKYRGPSPIQSVLLNGEKETGVTIMLMDQLMDHGKILLQEKINIDPDETHAQLEDKLYTLSEKLILKTIPQYLDNQITPLEQNHDQATFCKIISKEDGKIDWIKPAAEIYNQYRAYSSWPGIWSTYNDQILKIKKITLTSHLLEQSIPGTVYKNENRIIVAAGKGSIEILELQLEGKTTTTATNFILGHKDFIGSRLA